MGKAGNAKKAKKKGPKGKKAREKAKIARRWGETDEKEPTPLRVGKSRLLQGATRKTKLEPVEDESSTSDFEEEILDEKEPEDTYESLLSTLVNKGNDQQQDESSSDEDETGEMSDASDEMMEDESTEKVEIPPPSVFSDRFCRKPLSNEELKEVTSSSVPWKKKNYASAKHPWELQFASGLQKGQAQYLLDGHKVRARKILERSDDTGYPLRSELGAAAFNAMSLYADALVVVDRRMRNDIHQGVIKHIMRHVKETRSLIAETQKRLESDNDDNDDGEWKRDQGYTRSTVLVLLPTRSSAFNFVETLVTSAKHTEKWDRFQEEFGPPETEGTDGTDDHRKRVIKQKSDDWKELFDDDKNTDDNFKVGIQWNMKKNRFRMFQDFLRSDIIVASPLGLKQLDSSDFLSSVEVCFVGRADVLMQQNWDHVDDCLSLLNQQPKDTNDTDFSRVRQYYLSGQSEHWRQLIIESAILDPSILSTFRKVSRSLAGQVKIRRRYPEPTPITSAVKQMCVRVPCQSFTTQGKSRVQYFMDKVFPTLQGNTLVFIQSYFDFVALRNSFIRQEFSDYASVTEYSRHTEVSRGRARFLQGRRKIMLYTGRAHFYLRHVIKGAHHLVFVGAPAYSEFYADHLNRLPEEESTASCILLFTKFEGHALERIVGSPNATRLMKSETSTFTLRAV